MPEQQTGPFLHTPIAYNFASESSNKIHDDETARRFGFRGGLVPGVASYGYLVNPAVAALGDLWLARGTASIRLVKPVYEGDRVTARATPEEGPRARLELLDSDGELCAEGWASLEDGPDDTAPAPDPAAYPSARPPEPEERPKADLEVLAPGTVLGSLTIGPWQRHELTEIAATYRDPDPRYAPEAPLPTVHPAHLLHEANQILVRNVLLGPWIHVGSSVRHLDRIDPARRHTLRGRVAEAVEKRGHEIVTLDLALLDDSERPIALVRHEAIIRPRQVADTGSS